MANEKRLIDANALLLEYCQANGCNEVNDEICPNCFTAGLITNAPTVDAVEVVHGHWRYYSTTMQECSNCNRHTARHKFKYCPHCGAVMEDKYNGSTD